MLDRPIGGLLGSADGHTAKCILFQLMAGFCAHKLPFWYERWLDKLKFYQYQNTPSKDVHVVSSEIQRTALLPSSGIRPTINRPSSPCHRRPLARTQAGTGQNSIRSRSECRNR